MAITNFFIYKFYLILIKIDFYQMMKFCKMQQRTFRFFISYRSCGRSCNDYHIQTTIEYTFM